MDYDAFKRGVLSLSRIDLNFYRESQTRRRIDLFIRNSRYEGYSDFLRAIGADRKLRETFVNLLMINVTEFFRNMEQWEVLEQSILPEILKRNSRPAVWCCACSTGEEACSLAMLLLKNLPAASLSVLATDIDAEALETAQKGIYGAAGLAKLPKGVKEAYFDLQDGQYAVKRKILRGVHYRQLDLLNDEYPKNCDLILCRNVLIYFTDEARERIYAKLSASLKEGGVLFVGSTEQVFSSGRYDLKGVHGFFYIKSGPRPAIHSIAEECAIK